MNIIEARTYDINGNLIEVLTGKDARVIAEVPAMIEALEIADVLIKTARKYFPKSVKNTDRFNLALANAAITSILKRIEG